MEIRDLIEMIRIINTKNGWRESVGNPPLRTGPVFPAHLALVHSEVSEALEAYRDRIWSDSRKVPVPPLPEIITADEALQDTEIKTAMKPVGVGPELADTIIRILDVCDIWNINIEYEIDRVLAFNSTRTYRHGGKVI
jgi:hypothetical protein